MAGLTAAGWVPKTLSDVLQSVQARLQAKLQPLTTSGEQLDVSADSLAGQVSGVICQEIADLWEAGTDVYNSQYAGTAEGVCKEQACQLVGVFGTGPSSSTTTLSISGAEGTSVAQGFTASNRSGQFATTEAVTITQGNADRVRMQIGGVSIGQVFTVTIGGVPFSFTATAPTSVNVLNGLVAAINGGSVQMTAAPVTGDTTNSKFDVLAIGQPVAVSVSSNLTVIDRAAQAAAQATAAGPIDVTAGTITSIVTPVNNVTAVTNRLDGVEGQLVETPQSLESRRRQAVRSVGNGSAESLKAKLPQVVPGVLSVNVYQNFTDSIDTGSRPPHSYETVVIGGSDQNVANAIWVFGPMGIPTYGNTTVTVTDSSGNPQTVKFTRPTQVFFWVKVQINSYDPTAAFPDDGQSQIKSNVTALGAAIKSGGLVIVKALGNGVYSVPGIADATIQIATSATAAGPPGAYSGTNLQLLTGQQGKFDTSRVSVIP